MKRSTRMAEAGVLTAVLAAGSGRRFGGGKLDAECAGKRLGEWALAAANATGIAHGIIIVPPTPPAFAAEAEGWTLLTNPDPERGLGRSVALAAEEAQARGAGSLLVLLADMPLVAPGPLRALAEAGAPAATLYPGGRPGVPALFGSDMFPTLARLEGDGGAARLLAARGDLTLIAPGEGTLLDIDTPDELERAAKKILDLGE